MFNGVGGISSGEGGKIRVKAELMDSTIDTMGKRVMTMGSGGGILLVEEPGNSGFLG